MPSSTDTDQIVAAILAAAQTAADGHNRADSYVTNYRIMLAKLRASAAPADGTEAVGMPEGDGTAG